MKQLLFIFTLWYTQAKSEYCQSPSLLAPSIANLAVKFKERAVVKYNCNISNQTAQISYVNGQFICIAGDQKYSMGPNRDENGAVEIDDLVSGFDKNWMISKRFHNISVHILKEYHPVGFMVAKYNKQGYFSPENNQTLYFNKILRYFIYYWTDVRIYTISDPFLQYAILPHPTTSSSVISVRLLQNYTDAQLNVPVCATDLENFEIWYGNTQTFHSSLKFQHNKLFIPETIAYENIRQSCIVEKRFGTRNLSTEKGLIFLWVSVGCLLGISLINVIVNYFTLQECRRTNRSGSKWYQLFAFNQGSSLRFTFHTLRRENEMLYEQIYMLIKHLKTQDKHIIVINRNAVETEAKYDYARFSGYVHLKSPNNDYEAPSELRKNILDEENEYLS